MVSAVCVVMVWLLSLVEWVLMAMRVPSPRGRVGDPPLPGWVAMVGAGAARRWAFS